MLLDRKAIETISVSAVRNSIVTSPFLDQFIADNDKEPSWDGNVYIYEDTSKKKNKLKVDCQFRSKERYALIFQQTRFLILWMSLT